MFERHSTEIKKAFTQTGKALHQETDLDLKTYEGLSDADFEHLTGVYGADKVTQYIQEMEKRRLLRR